MPTISSAAWSNGHSRGNCNMGILQEVLEEALAKTVEAHPDLSEEKLTAMAGDAVLSSCPRLLR